MTSKNASPNAHAIVLMGAALMVAATAAAGGCGNYSNEDLEFMSALPERNDVSAELPAQSALEPADRAELYRTTRTFIGVFNGMVDNLLGLIDTIRSYSPTSRSTDERIWGPFAADKHPGWQVRMVVDRQADLGSFTYRIEYQRAATAGDPGTDWLPLVTGSYAAAGGVRKGTGAVSIDTRALRAATFDPGLGFLDVLAIDYDTSMFPVTVDLTFDNLPDPSDAKAITQGTYHYAAQSNGQGALGFDFSSESIPGPVGIENFRVTSRWLETGEGRADLQVLSGDAAGLQQTECWDRQFQAVYNDKPWATGEDVPGDPPGDPALFCPAIPSL